MNQEKQFSSLILKLGYLDHAGEVLKEGLSGLLEPSTTYFGLEVGSLALTKDIG